MDLSVKDPNPLRDPCGHTLTVKQVCFIVTTFEFYHNTVLCARIIIFSPAGAMSLKISISAACDGTCDCRIIGTLLYRKMSDPYPAGITVIDKIFVKIAVIIDKSEILRPESHNVR